VVGLRSSRRWMSRLSHTMRVSTAPMSRHASVSCRVGRAASCHVQVNRLYTFHIGIAGQGLHRPRLGAGPKPIRNSVR
jgi:hypothetical protein